MVHTATLDANGATTSPAGNIKVNLSDDNVISFEGSLAHADADFTVAATSALNDGTIYKLNCLNWYCSGYRLQI